MAYGLRVINDNSELLIDSDYVNPTFVQKLEFNATPTFTEAGPSYSQVHPNYIRRDYSTPMVMIGSGEYIVMWSLPDAITQGQPEKDVWYQFTTSEATGNLSFDCSVYANSQGTPISYSLPTAYIFTTNAAGINAMSSTGPALRMYNSAGVKTFDSNLTQLVPFSISSSYSIPNGETSTSLYLGTTMLNPIYLLPKTALMFAGDNGNGFSNYKVFDVVYKRRGQYIDTRTMSTSYTTEDYSIGSPLITFPAGTFTNLNIITADGDFYQTSGAGTGGGSNPTYTLGYNYASVNEGSAVTITLTTTLVADNTPIAYTVTGISAADLTSGSLTGSFIVQSNAATASFTFASDNLTEGTEIFTLTLNGMGISTSVNVLDTSKSTTYSWDTPSSIDEGTTGSLNFNYVNAPASTTFTFTLQPPSSGTGATSPADGTLNTTTFTTDSTGITSGSVAVSYSITADSTTEVTEYFRLQAAIGVNTYYSNNIQINDTSLTPGYGITAVNAPWNENNTQSTTVTLTNVSGYTYYPTSDSANVTCQTTSFTVPNNSYTTTLYWTVGSVTADTTVNLYLRRSRSNGIIDAQTSVVVKDVLAAGTPIGSAYCLAYGTSPYTLRQVYANGSGGTYNTDTNNSITCGYPTYTLTRSVTSVNEGQSFTITFTTNQSGSFPYTISGVTSADIGGASLTGSLSNNAVLTINVTADNITDGNKVFTISLNNGGASTTVNISDTSKESMSITQSGNTTGSVNSAFTSDFTLSVNGSQTPANWSYTGTLPPGLSFTKISNTSGVYYNIYRLSGTPTTAGSYYPIISASIPSGASTSLQIFPTIYAQAGTTNGGTYCEGTTLKQNYNDGSGGVYSQVVQTNSTSCGYVAPSYSLYQTFTSLANGSSGSFAVLSNNANGIILTPTLSGASAGRLTISPTSSAIAGSSNVYTYFTITASTPTTSKSAETVTVSVAGLSFSFTLQAFNISTIPLVTSVTYTDGQYYYNGDVITAVINFGGPITAATYVRVQLNAGLYGTGNNVFQAGQTYSNASFPIGASSGYYISVANPGIYNTTARVSARTEDVNGTLQQAYVDGTLATLYKAGVPPP